MCPFKYGFTQGGKSPWQLVRGEKAFYYEYHLDPVKCYRIIQMMLEV
jgi:hypothetical protein